MQYFLGDPSSAEQVRINKFTNNFWLDVVVLQLK